jgi:hypothetical protein
VPERSLAEAATLCALKSWRKDDAKAEVLLAKVKDVRKVKGAAMGSVAVDQVGAPACAARSGPGRASGRDAAGAGGHPSGSGQLWRGAVGRGASKRQRKDKR